jgi:citrate lyase subunit gamma (acyl carrier protein)
MVEKTPPTGQAGTLESCDCRIILEITDCNTISIEVEGPMKDVFGAAVTEVAMTTLKRKNIESANLKIMDRGALDYVVEARIEAAISAAFKEEVRYE